MESDEEQLARDIEDAIRGHPPSCVAAFRLTPADLPVAPAGRLDLAYRLRCACGNGVGAVLGYPASALIGSFQGAEFFLSPLAFACRTCNRVTELLDTDLHGYHAELGRLDGGPGSSKIRGSGERERFRCPGCPAEWFTVDARFVWWDFDLALDEPELPAQDFFNEFVAYGTCETCGQISQLTDFGKL